MYDGKERFDPIIYDNGLHFTHSMMCNAGGSFWEMHTNQSKILCFYIKMDFVYYPEINEYMGNKKVQMVINNFRVSQ